MSNMSAPKIAKPKVQNEFQAIFGELRPALRNERVIEDFSCGFQKGTMIYHGRMYVCTKYVCFNSTMFKKTIKVFRLRDIVGLTKRSTSFMLPGALEIVIRDGIKLYFTNFLYRESAYKLMLELISKRSHTGAISSPAKLAQHLLDAEQLAATTTAAAGAAAGEGEAGDDDGDEGSSSGTYSEGGDDDDDDGSYSESYSSSQSSGYSSDEASNRLSPSSPEQTPSMQRRAAQPTTPNASPVAERAGALAVPVAASPQSSHTTTDASELHPITPNPSMESGPPLTVAAVIPPAAALPADVPEENPTSSPTADTPPTSAPAAATAPQVKAAAATITTSTTTTTTTAAAAAALPPPMPPIKANDLLVKPMPSGKNIVDAVLPISLEAFFSELLGNESSFTEELHSSLGYTERSISHWAPHDDDADGCWSRTVCWRMSLNNRLGPKSTRVEQTWLAQRRSADQLVLQTSSLSLDVPYSDAFLVKTYWDVRRFGKQVKLLITAEVAFSRSVWIKGAIEKGAMGGAQDYFPKWITHAEMAAARLTSANSVVAAAEEAPRRRSHHKRSERKDKAEGRSGHRRSRSDKPRKSTRPSVSVVAPVAAPTVTPSLGATATPSEGGWPTIDLMVIEFPMWYLLVALVVWCLLLTTMLLFGGGASTPPAHDHLTDRIAFLEAALAAYTGREGHTLDELWVEWRKQDLWKSRLEGWQRDISEMLVDLNTTALCAQTTFATRMVEMDAEEPGLVGYLVSYVW